MILAHCNLRPLGSNNSPASASRVARITGVRYYTQLIFVLLVEKGFLHVGQAGFLLCFKRQDLEPTKMPINDRLDKENVAHIHHGILGSH